MFNRSLENSYGCHRGAVRDRALVFGLIASAGLLGFDGPSAQAWPPTQDQAETSKDASASNGRFADQEALEPFAGLVGEWNGTGQRRRGVIRGAWRESASWSWALKPESAALVVEVEDGDFLKSARLEPNRSAADRFRLEATFPDDRQARFAGSPDDKGRLVLTIDESPDSDAERDPKDVRRITITPLHDTRLLVLFEGQRPGSRLYHRLAEVGYTRAGIQFAAGESAPVCIVTGGRGTIEVSHNGRVYHVCCTGCRDLFEDDPEGVIADARRRAKEEKEDEPEADDSKADPNAASR